MLIAQSRSKYCSCFFFSNSIVFDEGDPVNQKMRKNVVSNAKLFKLRSCYAKVSLW